MTDGQTDKANAPGDSAADDVPFSSNAVRLDFTQWSAVILVIVVPAFVFGPRAWEWCDSFEPGIDYRIPYELSNDYWWYGRVYRRAVEADKVLVVGDSVVWGQYVQPDRTLSHYLNELAGEDRFANLGLDGSHPLALAGLMWHYTDLPDRKRIILHYNPLWMTSERHDLQTPKEFRFNHPRLVAQFDSRLACYTASYAERLGIAINRDVDLFAWADHARLSCFGGKGLGTWTLERPYDNPLSALLRPVPQPQMKARHEPIPWHQRGIDRADFPWVEPDASFQFGAFLETVAILQAGDRRLLVVVGPFNEHMLTDKSRKRYAGIKNEIAAHLELCRVRFVMPSLLPSDTYGDASHPLAQGYAMLAKHVYDAYNAAP